VEALATELPSTPIYLNYLYFSSQDIYFLLFYVLYSTMQV